MCIKAAHPLFNSYIEVTYFPVQPKLRVLWYQLPANIVHGCPDLVGITWPNADFLFAHVLSKYVIEIRQCYNLKITVIFCIFYDYLLILAHRYIKQCN